VRINPFARGRSVPTSPVVRENPFPRGPERTARYLFGRSDQIASLERFVTDVWHDQSANLMGLLAAPGLGKTCLLKHMQRELKEKNWLCGYSEASPEPGSAISDLLTDAANTLDSRRGRGGFRDSLQGLKVSAGPVGLDFKLGNPDEGTAYERLSAMLYLLGERARKADTGVALLLDEAQAFPPTDLELLLRVVSNLMYRFSFPIAVVLAGLPDIPSKFIYTVRHSHSGPDIWYESLYPLERDQAELCLKSPAVDAGYSFAPGVLERLVDFAGGHPLTLQTVGSVAWVQADWSTPEGEPLVISEANARSAMASVKAQLTTATFEPFWARFTETEKAVLYSLAEQEKTVPRSGYQKPGTKWDGSTGQFSWEPEIHPLERALWDVHPEARRVIRTFLDRGIIHHVERDGRLGFATPGFADFVIFHSDNSRKMRE